MRNTLLAVAGIAALTGGSLVVTDAAVAKKHSKHAKKHATAKKRTAAAELTGDTKTQAEAAALAAVTAGTVKRSFAAKADNPDGAVYVVRVTNADDEDVDVLEDARFNVIKTVEGGRPCAGGDHGDRGGPAALTGDAKTQAEAAALAAVPGGEVERSHAARPDNPDGAVYAVDVETADDAYKVVLEDASFNVIKVIDRPEHGGPGHRGPHPPQADDDDES
ncbi:MAG: hypothetical protein ACJ762_18145 [Solirubrobacteraceae bacterium]